MTNKRLLQAVLRKDLVAFTTKVFQTVNPSVTYVQNWHVRAIVHQLMEITDGRCLRLIINQPPRSLKSLCVSIAYVAWRLGHDPSLRIVVVSYSNDLAKDLHRLFRMVVTAPWYRELFPNVHIVKETSTETITSKGGGRLALSVFGSFTGRGADLAIIDDPQKGDDAFSDVARLRLIQWLTGTFFSRLNDKATTPVILVQQRFHEDDASGFLLRQGGWRHLKLAAKAAADEDIPLDNDDIKHRKEGEPLEEEREGIAVLAQTERDMGSMLFSAQYQQEPVPLAGNLIKRAWFKLEEVPPVRQIDDEIVQSWDIASQIGPTNDYSVCLTFLKRKNDHYLIDVFRDRLQYPDLRRKMIAHAQAHNVTAILIEDAGPGQALLQDLMRDHPVDVPRPIGRKPEGSKEQRMIVQSAKIEGGQVHIVKDASWVPTFLHEILAFPHGRHDDQVDALSQYLAWTFDRRSTWGLTGLEHAMVIY